MPSQAALTLAERLKDFDEILAAHAITFVLKALEDLHNEKEWRCFAQAQS
jgi:hypothetical protein